MLTTQGPEIRNAELWKCIFGYSVGRNVKKSRNPWHPHVPSCTFMALMGLESTLNGAGKTDSTDSTLLKTLSVWGQYPAYCFLGKSHLITGHPSQYGNLLKDPLWFQRSPNRGAVQRLHSLCTTKKIPKQRNTRTSRVVGTTQESPSSPNPQHRVWSPSPQERGLLQALHASYIKC